MNARDREAQQKERVLGEIGMKRRRVIPVASAAGDDAAEAAAAPSKQRMRVVRQNVAVGGLDQDFYAWGASAAAGEGAGGGGIGMSKRQLKAAAREKPFTDFDASKTLRKGGKKGAKAFKSKAKYKRRK